MDFTERFVREDEEDAKRGHKKRKSENISMIKPIVTDAFFLGQKSEQAAKQDLPVGQDLQDTLQANRERCVGMAANMIGVKKRIIIVNMGLMNIVMFNPVLIRKDTPYETEEGCLSLPGVRKTTRYRNIEVEYLAKFIMIYPVCFY